MISSNSKVKCFMMSWLAVAVFAGCASDKLFFEYTLNHQDGHYAVGELVEASILVKDKQGAKVTRGKLTVDVQRMLAGKCLVEPREYDLAQTNPIVLAPFTSKVRENVKICVHGEGSDGHYDWINPKNCYALGVGFDLEKIQPVTPYPDDFATFWRDAVSKAEAEIPLDVKIELQPELSKGKCNFNFISFAAPNGRRVYGYFTVPKDASSTNRYPVRVEIPGAGWGRWSNWRQAPENEVFLFLYVYPFQTHPDNWKSQTDQYDQHVAELRKRDGFNDKGNPQGAGMFGTREDSYFYPVLVTDVRAVKWVTGLDFVDAKRVAYYGHSQGGGLGLALVGLCDGIFRRACISCPALCNMYDSVVGRMWYFDNYPATRHAALRRNLPYYDAVNFARLVHCPVRVAVGMCDSCCPPMDVYAAYNVIPSKDKMIIEDGVLWGHGIWSKAWGQWSEWLTAEK